ncbi:MAG: hypothetical protein HQK49_21870 [Oligoflexia bacterium]|nr:hypothetical protein [Oligoflexia bacterium]
MRQVFIFVIFLANTILFLFSSASNALETDQYLVWKSVSVMGGEIKDSADYINRFLNDGIKNILSKVNSNVNKKGNLEYECEEVMKKILKYINKRKDFGYNNSLASTLWKDNSVEKIPQTNFTLFAFNKDSIYKNDLIMLFTPLGPSIRVNDIYIGLDKLIHMFVEGSLYYKIYADAIKNDLSVEDATIHAINKQGIKLERGVYGYKTSRTFSYGDLEANFQGLLFARRFCEDKVRGDSDTPYLKNNNGKWELTREIDIKDYINPYMDESFSNSHYLPSMWNKIKPQLQKVCYLLKSEWVIKQREYYSKFAKSFSQLYLEKLIKQGDLNDPRSQSIDLVCKEYESENEDNKYEICKQGK